MSKDRWLLEVVCCAKSEEIFRALDMRRCSSKTSGGGKRPANFRFRRAGRFEGLKDEENDMGCEKRTGREMEKGDA